MSDYRSGVSVIPFSSSWRKISSNKKWKAN